MTTPDMKKLVPTVSVIVPTYNRAEYVRDAIDSILAQTYQDFEIIVVDDGSTDHTKEVLGRYDGKITYLHQSNGGSGSARNLGIRHARGKYIAFLDSDDFWLSTLLDSEVRFLEQNHYDFVHSKMIVTDINGHEAGYKPSRKQENTFDWFIKFGRWSTSTVLVKKECFEKVGYFDESLRVVQDYDQWLRIARHFRIGFLNETLSVYRQHENNISNDQLPYYRDKIEVAKKCLKDAEILEQYGPLLVEKVAKYQYLLAKAHYQKQEYSVSLSFLLQALRYRFLVGKLFWDFSDSLSMKMLKLINPYGLLFFNLVRGLAACRT